MAFGRNDDLLVDGERIRTARLLLRPWVLDDAEAALTIYGAGDVSRWLAPAVERVPDIASMRAHLASWMVECASLDSCQGRWAIVGSVAAIWTCRYSTSRTRTDHHEFSFPVPR
jgi:RimJ/RimL family protein N-acetyltransferase